MSEPDHGRRIRFPAEWRASDGTELRFNCLITPWSDFDGAWAFDWHPADATTWAWLAAARARRDSGSAPLATTPTPGEASWRDILREAREGLKLSRKALARRSGMSASLIEKYECGLRPPSREGILALTHALELDGARTNAILAAAGLPEEPSDFALRLAGERARSSPQRFTRPPAVPPMGWGDIQGQIDDHSWACIATDTNGDIRAANNHAEKILAIPLRSLPGPDRNLLAVVTSDAFRERAPRWREAASLLLPPILSPYLHHWRAGSPRTHLGGVVRHIRRRSPDAEQLLEEVLAQWNEHPGSRSARVVFTLDWASEFGPLRLHTLVTPYNTWDPAWAIDFHPADAETAARLQAAGF